ncbi:MAG TPA: archease [archaeon]|nr:archease [archaeon]
MKHRFLENVAIADIAFEAEAETLEGLFAECGKALTETMADPEKIGGAGKKEFSVEGKTNEELLYNFLSELVYVKDVEGLLFKKFEVKIFPGDASVKCSGDSLEKIGAKNLRNDVKAITMHLFKIEGMKKGFKATVVVDI